jgi:hypothetical protein
MEEVAVCAVLLALRLVHLCIYRASIVYSFALPSFQGFDLDIVVVVVVVVVIVVVVQFVISSIRPHCASTSINHFGLDSNQFDPVVQRRRIRCVNVVQPINQSLVGDRIQTVDFVESTRRARKKI